MNKIDKKIKLLAEKHYYGRQKLTSKQREILENSKYRHLLRVEREYFEFDKILENFDETTITKDNELTQKPVQKQNKFFMFQSKLPYIKDLLDEIEDTFYLGLENFGLDRYKKIDVNQLRAFIKNYASRNIKDGTLLDEVKRAMMKSTPWSIMYNLRMLLTR